MEGHSTTLALAMLEAALASAADTLLVEVHPNLTEHQTDALRHRIADTHAVVRHARECIRYPQNVDSVQPGGRSDQP